ncbi:MAG: TonB-dependent receptor [Chryseolinea sp.]
MKKYIFFLAFSLALFGHEVMGQDILDHRMEVNVKGLTLSDAFSSIERKYPVRFYFDNTWFENVILTDEYSGRTLREFLTNTFSGSEISFSVLYNYAIILSKGSDNRLQEVLIKNNLHTQGKSANLIKIGERTNNKLVDKAIITGVITDGGSGAGIEGVSFSILDLEIGTVTNKMGNYKLDVISGEHILEVRSIGYETKVIRIEILGSATFNLQLETASRVLSEVVVTGDHVNVLQTSLGAIDLKISDMKKLPTFLGEVDIIKQIQTLAGVTSAGDVSSGFNVRGGGADQNLVLYDGVQVFNTSHVFGFFSAFNAEAVKDAQFYKAGIPAEYGGRVSSVLSLNTKEASYEKWHASGGIGLVSSNLTIGGPIKKDRSTVIASFRTSYSDWMLKLFTHDYPSVRNSSVSFYDGTVKLAQRIGEKGKLSLSGYVSNDVFGLPNDTTFHWKNILSSVHYDQALNDHLLFNVSAGYGQYAYVVSDKEPEFAYRMKYRIQYPSLNSDLSWQKGIHKIKVGVQSMYYYVEPTSLSSTSEASSVVPFHRSDERYWENSLYISESVDFTEKLSMDLGFRLSNFTALGPGQVYVYDEAKEKSDNSIIDTVSYGSNQKIKNYTGPEPRATLNFRVTPTFSIKGGYNRIYQYLHLISNSVSVSPIDVWQPSNRYFSPQRGDQISVGFFNKIKDGAYDISLEFYYKKVYNILDFKDGSELVLNNTLEQDLLTGKAEGYGAEFTLNKTKGRLTWNFNYTYARTFRTVSGINDGKKYPSSYDQPHIVNFNWKYGMSRRFSFTGNFSFRSGRPITIPYSYTVIDNVPIVNYSDRNGYRIPDYHRLDLALVVEGSHRKNKIWDGTWVFSIYNVYGRKNVYSVFYRKNGNGLQQAYSMSVIGSVLPSISYQFKI